MVKDRIGPVQIAIVSLLSKKPMSTSELFESLRRFGLRSRSSFYSALSDLERDGYIERFDDSYKITEKGAQLIDEIPHLIKNSMMPMFYFISNILSLYKDLEVIPEDPNTLLSYKKYLEEELKKVEEKLKKWKKIEIK